MSCPRCRSNIPQRHQPAANHTQPARTWEHVILMLSFSSHSFRKSIITCAQGRAGQGSTQIMVEQLGRQAALQLAPTQHTQGGWAGTARRPASHGKAPGGSSAQQSQAAARLRAVVDGQHHLVTPRLLQRLNLVHDHGAVGWGQRGRRGREEGQRRGAAEMPAGAAPWAQRQVRAAPRPPPHTKVDDGLGHREGEGAQARAIAAGQRAAAGQARRRWAGGGGWPTTLSPAGAPLARSDEALTSCPAASRAAQQRSWRARVSAAHPPTSTSALGAGLESDIAAGACRSRCLGSRARRRCRESAWGERRAGSAEKQLGELKWIDGVELVFANERRRDGRQPPGTPPPTLAALAAACVRLGGLGLFRALAAKKRYRGVTMKAAGLNTSNCWDRNAAAATTPQRCCCTPRVLTGQLRRSRGRQSSSPTPAPSGGTAGARCRLERCASKAAPPPQRARRGRAAVQPAHRLPRAPA